jgi:PAS domain S-box-containing protein
MRFSWKKNNMDIKRMERACHDTPDKLGTLLADANDILFELDEKGCFKYISPSVEKITQFTVDEISGQHFSHLMHPENVDGTQFGFEFTREGRIEPQVFRVRKKSGEWIYLQCFSRLKVKDGQAEGATGVMTDVTLRKQTEQALRNNEAYFRALIENTVDVILVLKEDGHIQYATPSVINLTGYSGPEVAGEDFFKFIYGGDAMLATGFLISLSGPQANMGNIELRLVRKDGLLRTAEIMGKNALADPAVKGLILNAHDVTEKRQMERHQRELEQDLHLASRLASMGQLAAGLAHEVNNPLASVIGFSQMLMRKDLPVDLKDKIKVINDEARRVSRIVQGLLTFARQDELHTRQVNLNDILNRIISLRSYIWDNNNIEAALDLDANLPGVRGDSAQLQQVFLNIILNAEKEMIAAHGQGRLQIVTEKIEGGVRVSITDNGNGICTENMPKLFTPFFTTRGVGEGTGLGLSISHGIVTRHKGKIYARSKPGNGATFVIELPAG